MNPMLNIAIRAARKAGNIIAKGYEQAPQDTQVAQKGANDYVTEIDKAAEAAIIEVIRKSYPDHAIVGEESGVLAGTNNDVQWVIDPLDGTTNFVKRLPHFAVSIAIRVNGRTEVGVVYDPIRNELFTAVRGEGTKLNEFRLRISNEHRDLQGIVLATGFPFKVAKHRTAHLNMIEALMNNGVADFRRTGSAALDLAYVAAGRVDGYFEIGLKPWDCAAGDLIAREAGALVTNFVGGTDYLKSGNVVAGSGRVLKEILNSIQPTLTEELKA
ncbi:inositol-1-monophosphatase [Glaesserella parasuis]|uniref:Inositol-1-monophosphatase n=1 Tax=Glaesserella parasuis serovar 5 (strain SH0165) TaxID=557723 RepID=B8F3A5_GLAP5|nr:inositol-1-monophosphatase [Glaesserella parasuis]ACL31807.1 inositol-1-monophosphatase (IMPase), putative mRNA turnover protein [Glaesserella parasuis SH0165]MDG6867914.1 inositol-1-monophosphatase [Glaesserella parasuis]MDO9938621.1 inositol-1-monophosphatase [Glaesserella parasuis]MDO9940687.1 inositol-1-monophosphatase [Glaesserella parasuis]MDP0010835.1 inositol-1-monophosphatase [Glaesserella parasuis]